MLLPVPLGSTARGDASVECTESDREQTYMARLRPAGGGLFLSIRAGLERLFSGRRFRLRQYVCEPAVYRLDGNTGQRLDPRRLGIPVRRAAVHARARLLVGRQAVAL